MPYLESRWVRNGEGVRGETLNPWVTEERVGRLGEWWWRSSEWIWTGAAAEKMAFMRRWVSGSNPGLAGLLEEGEKKQNYTRDIVNKCKTWTSLFTTQLIIRWSLEKLLIFWLVPSFQGSGLCPLCRSTSWGWLAYVVMSVLYLQGSRVPAGGPLRGGTDTGKHIAMEPRQGPGNCSLITGLFLHIYIEDNGYSIQRVLYSY